MPLIAFLSLKGLWGIHYQRKFRPIHFKALNESTSHCCHLIVSLLALFFLSFIEEIYYYYYYYIREKASITSNNTFSTLKLDNEIYLQLLSTTDVS